MLVHIAQMRQKRCALIKQLRASHERIAAENREYSADEQSVWEKRNAEIDKLSEKIVHDERIDQLEKDELAEEADREYAEHGRPYAGSSGFSSIDDPGDGHYGIRGQQKMEIKNLNSEKWIDRTTGRQVHVLRNNESMAGAINMQDRDNYDGLSFGRYVRAMVLGARTEAERRALSEGTDSAGGFTTPVVLLPQIIDNLRAAAQTIRAGAQTVILETDDTKIAKLTSDPTASWHSENAAVTDADVTFASITFTPQTLIALVRASRELIEDSINLEFALNRAFAGALGAELDRVVLRGTGTAPEPRGITNTTNVNVIDQGANGSAITNFDELIDAIDLIRRDNVNDDIGAAIMHPREWTTYAKMKDSQNQPLQRPSVIADIPYYQTTNLLITETKGTSSDASKIVLGHWPDVLIGIRSRLNIQILKERFSDNFQYGFLASMRADVALARPEGMAYIDGVIP